MVVDDFELGPAGRVEAAAAPVPDREEGPVSAIAEGHIESARRPLRRHPTRAHARLGAEAGRQARGVPGDAERLPRVVQGRGCHRGHSTPTDRHHPREIAQALVQVRFDEGQLLPIRAERPVPSDVPAKVPALVACGGER